ncbi:AAA family ATPase, partial [Kitasatospora sp. NPDC001683]
PHPPLSRAPPRAIDAARADVRQGLAGAVPPHLRDAHYGGAGKLGHGRGYQYPHDLPEGIAAQQYAPDSVHGREYYQPNRRGGEVRYADTVEWTRGRLRGERRAEQKAEKKAEKKAGQPGENGE